ncbi:MAG TPA: hypothetical protein VF329_08910 [Gammaproteobacteria bacterium]
MLANLHALLADIYALELAYDIEDFLITDPKIANLLDANGRSVDEKLLIAERDGQAEVSLYLEASLVERLAERDPTRRLDERNLADFWTAFEGVSHFAYYAWNAALEKPVRLLEMELQAEVDKFIATSILLQRQDGRPPAALHEWLFERPRFDRGLSQSELRRYRAANRYAGKYCLTLGPDLAQGLSRGSLLHRELRRFYRLSQPSKIRHIESL